MRKLTLFVSLLFFSADSGSAALRFGLGNAVAKHSAELIDKAAANDPANAVGDAVAATLAHCPASAIYDTTPTDLSMIAGIDPLGHVAPSGHTFPTDHIYFYAATAATPPVYAPGTIHITNVIASQTSSYSDYSLYFYPCRELKSYFFHVRTLSPALLSQIGAINQNCYSYSTGGISYTRCDKNVHLVLQAGDLIGYGPTSSAFDFGTYDYRITPLAFVAPSRQYTDRPYTVCPIDYFSSGPKAAMEAKLGRFDGGQLRTALPLCGEINFDIGGTARGQWYRIGSPDIPEDPHLALIVNNVYAPQQTISYGTSLPNAAANFYTFVPNSAGLVNRDFSQVTSDGQIYCYDTFFDPIGQALGGSGPTFILQMTSPTAITFERQSASSCGAGPWAFTSNAVTFQR